MLKLKLILRLILHFLLLAIYWICTILSKALTLIGKGADKLLEMNTEHTDNMMENNA